MPKISDLDYVSEIDATSYLLGVKGGSTVRFPASVLQGEASVVNTTFIGQGDTPTSYIGQTGKLAAVNAAEDALEFIDAPTSLPTGGAAGQVLTKNSATDGDAGWADGGAETFLGLSDTPDSYAAYPGKVVAVKADGSGLEFASPSSGSYPIIDLSSATTDYALAPGEVAYVKYTSATSIPLHIETEEGVYEIKLYGGDISGTNYSGVTLNLNPNNVAVTAGAINYSRINQYSTTVNGVEDVGGHTGFALTNHPNNICAECTVFTTTKAKAITGYFVLKKATDQTTQFIYHEVWMDTTVIWYSLGTLVSTVAGSGIVLIKRIV